MILVRSEARAIPLADESVQCVVTSPPYWGLRDYQFEGQIGLEETPEEYIQNLVEVFREVRRVLRGDGTVWLNLGDSYAGAGDRRQTGNMKGNEHGQQKKHKTPDKEIGLKPKDLCMIPARVALALQADGWWVRSEIVWAKPNPMPESTTDRPTRSHEMIYLLTKSGKYYYDADAVREPHLGTGHIDYNKKYQHTQPKERKCGDGYGFKGVYVNPKGRNLRSVWTIPTQAFPGAHFATFPEKLVEPCIKAGTSAKGCCPECGAGWVRISETTYEGQSYSDSEKYNKQHGQLGTNVTYGRGVGKTKTIGWQPSCSCGKEPIPCVVLDPFGGSGTVARVAMRLGRKAIHCDLAYHELAKNTRCTNIQTVMNL